EHQGLVLLGLIYHIVDFILRQIEFGHLPDHELVAHLIITVPVQATFALALSNQGPPFVWVGKVGELLALDDLGQDVDSMWLPSGALHYKAHSAGRPE